MSNKIDKLKAKVLKAQKNSDIASMYILQEEALKTFDEDTVSGFYANILDLALENLTNTLEACKSLEMDKVQDFATLRALYEYAMEHYHAEAYNDASALFEVLGGITKDENFSIALSYHKQASQNSIPLDDFMSKYTDIEETQKNKTFYISCFTNKAQELLSLTKKNMEQ